MITIRHRVNDIETLRDTPNEMGVEIDIRTSQDNLILSHDPFTEGLPLNEWIKKYNHRFLILNTKEDGLEDKILEVLNNYKIEDFFFLDQPFPSVRKTIEKGCSKIALRFSEYESMSSLEMMSGQCEWVWIDSFKTFSHDLNTLFKIRGLGYKLCFVSPELQGRDSYEERQKILEACNKLNAEAICTKSI